MDRRAALLIVATVSGCSGDGASRAIDLCGRGDGLAEALAGGELRLSVQSGDGVPIVSGAAAADRATAIALAGAAPGDRVVVEGLDAGGAPVAYGSATLGERGGCVCVARHAWRALTVWSDGAAHFGLHAGFFVATPAPGLVATTPLSLDHGRVAAGDQLVVSFGFTNTAAATLSIRGIQILARPPGATHESGLVADFTSQPPADVAPGAGTSAQASRTFGDSDPAGVWSIFSRTIDALGDPHDGPELELLVGPPADPLSPRSALRLNRSWVAAGDTLHGNQSLENPGGSPVTVASARLSARPPGAGDADGPSFDFSNPSSGVVPAGGTLDLSGDRIFGVAEDACAGLACSVQAGQCSFAPGP